MNRLEQIQRLDVGNVPRRRGDEPSKLVDALQHVECSPQARG